MSEIIITKKQLSIIQETISKENNRKLANENWEKFSIEQKEYIVECLKVLYPNKAKRLDENKWYNTLGDIVGIFDPTGVVDLVNGISYISQGDNLFGFLSLISAVPYIGDIVAKPVMGALKIGAPSAKALEGVLKLSKAGKSAEAAAELEKLTASGGIVGKFVEGFGKIASKVRGFIEKMPMGPFKGLKNTILQWFDLFEKGAVAGKGVRAAGTELAAGMKGIPAGTGALMKLSKADQIKNLESLVNLAKETPGLFSGYRTTKGLFSGKTLFRGMPQLIGRNASVRALTRQTKWWLGFLDFLGLGNWVGPDEALAKMGDTQLEQKLTQYQQTPKAQQYFQDSFGTEMPQQTTQQTQPTQSTSTNQSTSTQNPVGDFFSSLFGSQVVKSAIAAV
jgi:hypothetical protein